MDLMPGLGRSPGGGNGNPLQYSGLENRMDRGAWQATVHGAAKNQTTERAHTLPSSLGWMGHVSLCTAMSRACYLRAGAGQGQGSPPILAVPPESLPSVFPTPFSCLSQDLARLQEGQQPEHRDVALQKVSDSEKLLYMLEADAAIAKHMKHPQGDMIAEE